MKSNIAALLHEKQMIELRISKIIYGSVEIRENENNTKYIYVHFRNDGVLQTKYVGEYSNELHNLILENNLIVKELKKRLKIIRKELGKLNYNDYQINDNIKTNIDFARKHMVDSIYKQANLEGIATTYSDTETIVNGGKIKNMNVSDISKVINLKRSWEFILSEGVITYPTNYYILCKINEIVEDGFSYFAGKIRSVPVRIGGSSYLPPIPFEDQVKKDIDNIINSNHDIIDIAIKLLLYVMKKQIFIDGNKRTAVIFANHFLINNGKGLIVVPVEHIEKYKSLLIDFYENDDDNKIKQFLKNKCYIML